MSQDALSAAHALQVDAARHGFDWDDVAPVWDKVAEELAELREAQDQGSERMHDELGDILFVIVNLARHLGINPSAALASANDKFKRRYGYVMQHAPTLPAIGSAERLERMEALWQQAKRLGL